MAETETRFIGIDEVAVIIGAALNRQPLGAGSIIGATPLIGDFSVKFGVTPITFMKMCQRAELAILNEEQRHNREMQQTRHAPHIHGELCRGEEG